MRNIVDQMREVLFNDLSTAVDIYEKTFNRELLESKPRQTSNNLRPEPVDSTVHRASDHLFVDNTQSVGFGSQPNAACGSHEVLETDNESVHDSIESAQLDTSTTTQQSSLSNASNEKEIRTDKWKESSL